MVSVVVVTYNSSKFVIDTLESVYSQDFEDIELIVSDDCSKDNTIELCREWIREKGERFRSAQVISTPHNKGICGNYNHALKHVKGEWIKFIAGDDMLLPNCISSLVEYTHKHSNKIFFGSLIPFSDEDGSIHRKATRSIGQSCYISQDPNIQLEHMLDVIDYVAEGPTIFVEAASLRQLGGMDERFPMCEDFPVAMKFALNGLPIGFVTEPLVLYREYEQSVAHSNTRFRNMITMAARDSKMKLALRDGNFLLWWHLNIFQLFDKYTVFPSPMKRRLSKLLIFTDIYRLKR